MTTRRSQRGFTLVEMMVVVAIVAILSGMIIGLSSQPYSANPRNFSQQLVETLSLAKTRAVSTRKWHRVEVTGPNPASPAVGDTVVLWQWSNTGMTIPAGTCVTSPVIQNCWQIVQQIAVPRGVTIHNAQSGVQITAGASPAQDLTLDFLVDFKPDGSSTGGTIFVTDTNNDHPWRVLVYRATGTAYGREGW